MRLAALVCVPCLALSATACLPPPGTGGRAERAFAAAAPVVVALERFRVREQRYPDSLPELAGRDIPAAELAGIDRALGRLAPRGRMGEPEPPFLGYRRAPDGAAYLLTLSYRAQGALFTLCRYESGRRAWSCGPYLAA